MRTTLFLLAFLALSSHAFAQGINYQALARNNSGNPMTNQPVTVEIAIYPDASTNTALYKEAHNLSTDAYGLFNLIIGDGVPAGGSFAAIDWSKTPLYLGARLNAGSGFSDLGRRAFQGTPFSFYAPLAGKALDMKLADLSDVQPNAPTNGQVLKWNGSVWAPAADNDQIYTAGAGVNISGNVISNTGDLSNTNELQTLSINGNQLSISNGNAVTLPTGTGGGDNWGTQTVATDATLSGQGTLAGPLKLAPQNATNGQVLKWNGASWAPAADNGQTYTAGTGISINGGVIANTGDTNPNDDITTASQAGGDLSGLFSNLQINANAVGTNEIANGSITAADLAAGVIPTTLPPNGSAGGDLGGTYPNPVVDGLQGRPVAATAPANGQALKWNGSAWAPAADNGQVYTAGTGISIIGDVIANTGDTNPNDDITTASQAGGDLSGPFSNLQINANAVGTNEIANGSITAADLAAGVIPTTLPPNGNAAGDLGGTYPNPLVDGLQGRPVATTAPANGQALKWNGSAWSPAVDNGQMYTAGTGISIIGDVIANTGDTNPNDDITTASQAGGDLSGPFSNLQINANAVGTNEIANGSITAADLAAGVIPTTLPPNGNAGGDLGGTYPNPVVDGLQGRPVAGTVPASGQVLSWNGSAWAPANAQGGSVWSTNGTNAFYNTGNVGIGTNTPQNLLQLHNSEPLFGSPSTLHLTNTTSGNAASDGLLLTINSTVADYGLIGGMMMRENTSLGFGTNNNYHLFLKQNGLLGMGTFNPQGKMDIFHNSVPTSPQLMISEDEAGGFGRINFRSGGVNNKYWTIAARTQANDVASQFNFYYFNGTNGQDILSVSGSGNVGIGTTTPAAKLDVNGTINTSGELNRAATGAANLAPISYGNVKENATINTGTGNFTVVKTGAGVYEITITGENFFFSNYITQVTLIGTAGFVSSSSVNGKLLVRTYNLGVGAVPSDREFSFVVFKP